MRPVRELVRLLLPVACPCGEPDVLWCARCDGLLAGPPVRVEHGAPRLDRLDGVAPVPVWALTAYTGPVRDVVVHWKDRGRADLDRLLAPALRRAARRLAPVLAPAGPLAVVPVPSTAAALRIRGRDPVGVLARAVAGGLRDGGAPARVVPALARRGRARDQVGLGARARGRNLAGSVRMTRRGTRALERTSVCILVDDVLTTGATLAAAERTLEAHGHDVLGATVLAATPAPDDRRRARPATATPSGEDLGGT
ncbi:ComF family protein [Promicromonospora thailandica]|uniref:ComF family protein n=1 Tax=Promicromonospora thailandica TaxID=765201 RepID=UPI0020A41D86|nr:phosphoribosyltransferase family protein [Promicromonospora thailandica]